MRMIYIIAAHGSSDVSLTNGPDESKLAWSLVP